MSRIVCCSKTVLHVREVERLLRSPPGDKVSRQPPVKPKGGEVYLFQGSTSTSGDHAHHAVLKSCMSKQYLHMQTIYQLIYRSSNNLQHQQHAGHNY